MIYLDNYSPAWLDESKKLNLIADLIIESYRLRMESNERIKQRRAA